jgi:hypothetical protein
MTQSRETPCYSNTFTGHGKTRSCFVPSAHFQLQYRRRCMLLLLLLSSQYPLSTTSRLEALPHLVFPSFPEMLVSLIMHDAINWCGQD